MNDARRMGKSELFSFFAERFEVKRTQAREFFDELTALAEKQPESAPEIVFFSAPVDRETSVRWRRGPYTLMT